MTESEAIQNRHSVRKYLEKPISEEHIAALQAEIDPVRQREPLLPDPDGGGGLLLRAPGRNRGRQQNQAEQKGKASFQIQQVSFLQ